MQLEKRKENTGEILYQIINKQEKMYQNRKLMADEKRPEAPAPQGPHDPLPPPNPPPPQAPQDPPPPQNPQVL